jgi:hypothetical protein
VSNASKRKTEANSKTGEFRTSNMEGQESLIKAKLHGLDELGLRSKTKIELGTLWRLGIVKTSLTIKFLKVHVPFFI